MDYLYDIVSRLRPFILIIENDSQGLRIETSIDDSPIKTIIPSVGSIIEIQSGTTRYKVTEVIYQQGTVTVRVAKV